ncbi:MAG: hypothetical protein Q4G65_17010 [bacterium]|nr:hypothetical protein [bacterium]
MPILALFAATAAADDGWISGQTLVAILSAIFGGTGLAYGGWKSRQAREEAERRRVEGEVKANVPQPLSVELKERFVTKETFRDHCQRIEQALKDHAKDNGRDFESIYNLVRANDKLTATIAGTLEAIKGDLSLIKEKLFRKAK